MFCWPQIQLVEGLVNENIPRTRPGMFLKVSFKSSINTLEMHWEDGKSQMSPAEKKMVV